MEEKQKTPLAINWMGHDGSELVNSWEMATRDTTEESVKHLYDTVEWIFKPESTTLLSGTSLETYPLKRGIHGSVDDCATNPSQLM